jgi:hypothetical protein
LTKLKDIRNVLRDPALAMKFHSTDTVPEEMAPEEGAMAFGIPAPSIYKTQLLHTDKINEDLDVKIGDRIRNLPAEEDSDIEIVREEADSDNVLTDSSESYNYLQKTKRSSYKNIHGDDEESSNIESSEGRCHD